MENFNDKLENFNDNNIEKPPNKINNQETKREIGYLSDEDDDHNKIKVGKLKINQKFKNKLANIIGGRSVSTSMRRSSSIILKTSCGPPPPPPPPLPLPSANQRDHVTNTTQVRNNFNTINQMYAGNLNNQHSSYNNFMNFLLEEHMEEYIRLKNIHGSQKFKNNSVNKKKLNVNKNINKNDINFYVSDI